MNISKSVGTVIVFRILDGSLLEDYLMRVFKKRWKTFNSLYSNLLHSRLPTLHKKQKLNSVRNFFFTMEICIPTITKWMVHQIQKL